MKDEMKSIQHNDIWNLVELSTGAKHIGRKWIFRTKMDSKGNIERYKTCLVAKGFTTSIIKRLSLQYLQKILLE